MLIGSVVVEGNDDDRARWREKLEWIDALLDISRHPRHIAVVAAGEPLFQSRRLLLERFRADNSNFVKAFEERAFFNRPRSDRCRKHRRAVYCIFWIVTVTIGVSPAVRLYTPSNRLSDSARVCVSIRR